MGNYGIIRLSYKGRYLSLVVQATVFTLRGKNGDILRRKFVTYSFTPKRVRTYVDVYVLFIKLGSSHNEPL